MRTYAPADTDAVLAGLLEEPSLARGVVHHAVLPPRDGRLRRLPGLARPADRGRARRPRHRAGRTPTRRRRSRRPRRPGRRRRHADRVGQDAVLRAAGPPGDRRGSGRAGAVPLPDQGARPGPGRGVRRAARPQRPARLGVDLRRRHAGADPLGGPGRRPGRGHQPGHAPLGDPPPPHEVVPAVRAAPGHRHRRAAHLPRRVRQPRRERPPPAAPDLRPLRQQAGHRLLLGDDREPGRARGDADRPAGSRSIDRNGAPAGERHVLLVDPPLLDPASGARGSAATLAQRWALPFLRAGRQTIVFGRSRVAVEILLTGLRESLRESYGPRSRVRGYRGGYLPTERRAIERGLRDGEILGVVATNALELGVDIGRLDVSILAGYPGSVAATWQQFGRAGPAPGHERRGPRRVGRAGRPVRHPPPGVPARGHARGGPARPGQPPRPARPPARRDVRAAVRAGRGLRARRRPTTCSRSSPRRATSARRATGAGTGRARTSRRRRSRSGPPRRRTS